MQRLTDLTILTPSSDILAIKKPSLLSTNPCRIVAHAKLIRQAAAVLLTPLTHRPGRAMWETFEPTFFVTNLNLENYYLHQHFFKKTQTSVLTDCKYSTENIFCVTVNKCVLIYADTGSVDNASSFKMDDSLQFYKRKLKSKGVQ